MSKKSSKNPGMSSSFKASNIQTYPEGGEMTTTGGGPGHPFALKHGIQKGSLLLNPFYTNSLNSAVIPQYSVGFRTGRDKPEKGGWSFTGRIGSEYPAITETQKEYQDSFQMPIKPPIPVQPNTINPDFNSANSLEAQEEKFKKKQRLYNMVSAIAPGSSENLSYGLNAEYRGKYGLEGQRFTPLVNTGLDFSQSGGLGASFSGGAQYNFGRDNYRQGVIRKGYAAGSVGPYGGWQLGLRGFGPTYGVEGHVDWKPKFFGRMPGMLYAKGNVGVAPITGLAYSGEVGLNLPMAKLKQMHLPEVDLPSMSSLVNLTRDNKEEDPDEANMQIPAETGTGWGEAGKVNASPIHQRWQPNTPDIYIPNQQGGNTIEWPPAEEGTESFAAGGSMGGWPPDKFLRGANLYSNAFYTNTNTGSLLPQANFGLSKSWGPKYAKNTLSADVGMPYGNNQIGDFGQNTSELGQQNFTETGAFGDPNLGAFDAKNPFSIGLHYGLEGSDDNTRGGRGSVNIDADYNTQTGLGVSGVGGLKYDFGRPANTYNEIRTGTANATLYPHFGFGAGHASNASAFAGLGAEANWKPRFLKRTPLSLYGKAQLQTGFGGGANDDLTSGPTGWQNHQEGDNRLTFRPSYSLQAGIKAPLRDIQSTVRGIDIRDLNLPSIERSASEESTEEGMPIPDGIGVDWEKGNQLNASPIHKRWQPNTGDIYIPPVTPFYGEPMTYDPATGQFENNTEEMNNYSKGGGIHIDPKNKGKFTASAEAAGMGTQEFASHVLANRGSYTPLQVQRANFAHNAASWQHAQGGFNNKGFQSLPPAVQAKIKANSFADGGQLTQFNEGGTHEESPLGGIPQGMAPDGKLNLVEEGETKLNAADYIFSDQIKIDKETATLYSLPKGDIGKTFAEVSKKLNRPNSRRENDTIEQVAIQRDLENLMQAQEKQKEMQKDADIAEFSAKYPELAQNLQAPQQAPQQSASMPQGQQQMPMSPEEQMMQEQMMQQQMAPPAEMPQQMVDPAMAAQMGQLPMSYGGALFNCGGKMYTGGGYMYNDGGHMYDAGGVLRNIGAGAYGIGEGLLDTLTFGLTDNLTDKGYNKLASMGHRAQSEIERDNMIRGFGNTAGAVGGAILTGGAATSSAVSEGAEGLAAGATNIKGTGEKFDKIANGIGQGVSMAAGFMGPQGATQAEGVFKGNEAVNKLMTAKQNPFINQATNFATNAINFADGGRMNYSMYQPLDHITQYGGPLNMPTANHPYLNYLAAGGGLEGETPTNPETTGVPKLAFNLNGIVVNYTLEEALKDPLVLEAYGADTDEDGNIKPESVEIAKLALEERFNEEKMPNRIAVGLAEQEYNAALNEDANLDVTNPNAENTIDQSLSMERLPGETDEEYAGRMHAMNMKLEQGAKLGEIKQTPMQGAIMALPAMYNLGRGIFEKPKTLDYEKYKRKGNLEPYTMNIDPQVAEVRKAYAGAAQAVKNAAPGSGAYLGNMANIAAGKQKDMNELLTKKEMFDKNSKFEVDKMNKEIEAQNLALEMQLQAYNDQARAAKMQSIQTGLSQLADIASNEQGVDLQEAYLKAVAPQYAKNFKYSSIFDQLQQTLKARKANKGKGK